MNTLEHYQQTYLYDTGNNLTHLLHQAKSSTWQQNINLHPNNNRGTETQQSTTDFDVNGNLLTLNNIGTLDWHYNNTLNKFTKDDKTTEYYVYDYQGNRVRTILESNQQIQNQRDYLPSLDISTNQNTLHIGTHILAETSKNNIQTRYQLVSHLQSNTLELNDKAQTISYEHYYPYGGTALIASTNKTQVQQKRYRYTSKETNDTSGLSYHHARYLAPWMARWISPDLTGTINGLNLYTYVTNNPLKYIDPTGHVAVHPIEGDAYEYNIFEPATETFHSHNLFRLPQAYQRLEEIVKSYPANRLQLLDTNTIFRITLKEGEGEGAGAEAGAGGTLKVTSDTFFSLENYFLNDMNFSTGGLKFGANLREPDFPMNATQIIAYQYLGMTKITGAINMLPQKISRCTISNEIAKNVMNFYRVDKNHPQFEYDFLYNTDNGRSSFRVADTLGLEVNSLALDGKDVHLHLQPQVPLRPAGNPRILPPRQTIRTIKK